MKKLGETLITVVDEENCVLKAKPPISKPCKGLPPCNAEWFMTSWTKVVIQILFFNYSNILCPS